MADESGDKTEAPTPRRRQEAREEGNLARSQDLTGGVMLLGAVLLLAAFGERMLQTLLVLVNSMLAGSGADITRIDDLPRLWAIAGRMGLELAAPVCLGLAVLGVLSGLLQVGFMMSGKPLMPKFSKISPLRGFSQLFSARGGVRFGMSLVKVAAVSTFAVICIQQDLPMLLALIRLDMEPLLAAASGLVWSLALKIAVLLLVLGILDYAYQRWQHEQDLKMSKQEIKEEFKRMEGDPLVKQRRAKIARQMAMQRMAYDVPKADVIVTNPTHFAVALKYDDDMAAPKVIAKGADYMAMRIRQIAAAHGIPVVERPPLARALYKTVEVGQQIPSQFYAAVAEILAYVYRLSGRKSA